MAREIIYPTFVFMLIASVWALGWEKSHGDALERGVAPPTTYNPWLYEVDADESADIPPAPPTVMTSTFDPVDQ